MKVITTRYCIFILLLLLIYKGAVSQDSVNSFNASLPSSYISKISEKAESVEKKLDKKSESIIAQIKRQEGKITRKLARLDSSAAKQMIENAQSRYTELEQRLKNPGKLAAYIPNLDSLGTSLSFLQSNPLYKQIGDGKNQLSKTIEQVDALKAQLQKAEDIRQFLKERKQYLKEQVEKFGFVKELKSVNKQVYYYAQQLSEYKEILNDPSKIERKALEILNQTSFFKDFMRKNSMLASLFLVDPVPSGSAGMASLAGLQTRQQVSGMMQQQIAMGGPDAQSMVQQNIQAAQSQLSHLKDKILKMGGGSSDDIMPEGFKPNTQKTKTFWKRIELGTNIQSQPGTRLLPTTSDFALTAGFKPNDKSVVGIGGSFKLGWGRDIQHISLSGQGLSLRSFLDVKLKGSFWISGGFEMNYRNAFRELSQVNHFDVWQQSGLVGLSKKIPVNNKWFRGTRVQLLYDFLAKQHVPMSQALLFRVGYNFK